MKPRYIDARPAACTNTLQLVCPRGASEVECCMLRFVVSRHMPSLMGFRVGAKDILCSKHYVAVIAYSTKRFDDLSWLAIVNVQVPTRLTNIMQTWSLDFMWLFMAAEVVATVTSALHCCCGMPGLPTMQARFKLAPTINMHSQSQSQRVHQHIHRPLSGDWGSYTQNSTSNWHVFRA